MDSGKAGSRGSFAKALNQLDHVRSELKLPSKEGDCLIAILDTGKLTAFAFSQSVFSFSLVPSVELGEQVCSVSGFKAFNESLE